jgi:RNA polymerase sigma-70 factor (ECF subfamily)
LDRRDRQFGEWMQAHLGVLHRIARGFAEPTDQPDLLQELMMAVWKAQPSFRADSQPVTFIWRVAHNRALTWRRRESARAARAGETQAEWLRMADADPAEAELLERLYAAIRRLSPVDRSIVLLSLEGGAYREIGALHELSETAVGARLTRARQQITRFVEGDGDGL